MMRSFGSDRLKALCMTRIQTLISSSPSSETSFLLFVRCDVTTQRTAYNGATQGGINTGNLNWGNNSFIDPSHYANLRTNNNTSINSTFSKKIDTRTDDKLDEEELEHLGNYTFNTSTFLTNDIDNKPSNIKSTASRYSHHSINNNNNNNATSSSSSQGNAQVDVKTNTNNTHDKVNRETGVNNPKRGFAGIPMKPQGSTFTDANSNVSARRNPLHSSATSHSYQNVLHESTMKMSSKVSDQTNDSSVSETNAKNNNNHNKNDKAEEEIADVRTFTAPHRLNDHVFHKTSHLDEYNDVNTINNNNNHRDNKNSKQGFGSVPYTQDGNQFRPTNDDVIHSDKHQHQDNAHNNNNKATTTKITQTSPHQQEHQHESKMDSVGSFTISSHAATKSANTHDHHKANTQNESSTQSKTNSKQDSSNLYNNDHTYTDANGNKMDNASHNYNPTTPSHHDKCDDTKKHNDEKKKEKKEKEYVELHEDNKSIKSLNALE